MARRLMTAAGVRSFVALAYRSVIDAPERFSKSWSVGAYLDLSQTLCFRVSAILAEFSGAEDTVFKGGHFDRSVILL